MGVTILQAEEPELNVSVGSKPSTSLLFAIDWTVMRLAA